jgi:hypothetical protein
LYSPHVVPKVSRLLRQTLFLEHAMNERPQTQPEKIASSNSVIIPESPNPQSIGVTDTGNQPALEQPKKDSMEKWKAIGCASAALAGIISLVKQVLGIFL